MGKSYWWQVNIVSGNALVPSGNKPWSDPKLTQISVAIWRHQATMSLVKTLQLIWRSGTCRWNLRLQYNISVQYPQMISKCAKVFSNESQRLDYKTASPMIYDDVINWKHFPRYRPFVRGIHRWPVNSPHKGQWRGALMFSLICAWING